MALRQRSHSPTQGWDLPLTHYRPSSLLDQMFHFPDQLFEIPSTWLDVPHEQIQAGRTTELVNTADKFKLNLAVEGYRPEELDVKVVRDRFLVVHGKHGERKETEGATGFVKREFTRSFAIPNGVDLARLKSNLMGDGSLIIEAPKRSDLPIAHERAIPIEFSST